MSKITLSHCNVGESSSSIATWSEARKIITLQVTLTMLLVSDVVS